MVGQRLELRRSTLQDNFGWTRKYFENRHKLNAELYERPKKTSY